MTKEDGKDIRGQWKGQVASVSDMHDGDDLPYPDAKNAEELGGEVPCFMNWTPDSTRR